MWGTARLAGLWQRMEDVDRVRIGIVSFANLTYAAPALLTCRYWDTIVALAQLQPRRLPPSSILQQRRDELLNYYPLEQRHEQCDFRRKLFMDYSLDSLKGERLPFCHAGKIIKVSDVVPKISSAVLLLLKAKKRT
jgi:hypothetical protein